MEEGSGGREKSRALYKELRELPSEYRNPGERLTLRERRDRDLIKGEGAIFPQSERTDLFSISSLGDDQLIFC